MKRFRWTLVAAALLAIGLVCWVSWEDHEPNLQGHPVSYWVKGWENSKFESPESVAAAHAAMDERHVRWLIRQLRWKPSFFRNVLSDILSEVGIRVSLERTDDNREVAAMALGRLGSRALPAIPTLQEQSTNAPWPRGFQAMASARAALVQLKVDGAAPRFDIVRNPALGQWQVEADVLARLGTNYPESAEIFSSIMFGTNAPGFRIQSTMYYGLVHPPDAAAVRMFMRAVEQSDTRLVALTRLAYIGEGASVATQVVASCFSDTNNAVRRAAQFTWNRIAPKLAPPTRSP